MGILIDFQKIKEALNQRGFLFNLSEEGENIEFKAWNEKHEYNFSMNKSTANNLVPIEEKLYRTEKVRRKFLEHCINDMINKKYLVWEL